MFCHRRRRPFRLLKGFGLGKELIGQFNGSAPSRLPLLKESGIGPFPLGAHLGLVPDLIKAAYDILGHRRDRRADSLRKNILSSPGRHILLSSGRNPPHLALSARWRTRWITFDGPLAEAYLMAFRYPRLLRGGTVPTDALFEKLKKTISDSDWKKIRKNTGILCQILAELAIGIGNPEIILSGQLVKQCMDFISSHLAEPELDLTMICDSLHVTPSSLNRLFRQKLGVSLGRYIQDCRKKEAQVLLLNTALSVKELAARCGFTDPNTFNRFIRRNMGMSPISYRKNIKQRRTP